LCDQPPADLGFAFQALCGRDQRPHESDNPRSQRRIVEIGLRGAQIEFLRINRRIMELDGVVPDTELGSLHLRFPKRHCIELAGAQCFREEGQRRRGFCHERYADDVIRRETDGAEHAVQKILCRRFKLRSHALAAQVAKPGDARRAPRHDAVGALGNREDKAQVRVVDRGAQCLCFGIRCDVRAPGRVEAR
jgi:hypothetical protein